MKSIKKMLAAALAACFVLSLAACSDTTWVYQYGDVTIPSGIYINMTISAYNEAQSHEDMKPDVADFFKQTLDGKPAKQWVVDRAKELCALYAATEKKYSEMGLVLSDEDKQLISDNVDTVWNQIGSVYEYNGVSKESFQEVLTYTQKNTQLFEKYYGADGTEPVKDEEIKTYFFGNYIGVNAFVMELKSGEDLSEEDQKANDELKNNAAQYVKEMNENGKTFGEVSDAYYHKQNGSDHDDTAEGPIKSDDETLQFVTKDSTNPSAAIVAEMFALEPGRAKAISAGDRIYIVKRYDIKKDAKYFENMKSRVLHKMKDDDFEKMLQEYAADMGETANTAAVNRYNPENIDLTGGEGETSSGSAS